MDWVEPFYTRRSRWLGPSGILDHHRARAASIGRLCGEGLKRVLELGAGAGGAAAALADLGHRVTAVESSPLRAAYARDLAAVSRAGIVEVIEGDFYTAAIAGPFDIVAYWDGFGVGSDADQRRLLRRVADEWLRAEGCMLLDVYNPFPWACLAGQTQRHDDIDAVQQRDFDMVGCRFIDRWWPLEDESQALAQSIRCYTPADLALLVEGTGLAIQRLEIDGNPVSTEAGSRSFAGSPADALSYLGMLVPRRPGDHRSAS